MRGIDADSGDYLGASRSQQRREALDVLELAETLTGLPEGQLTGLPIPEDIWPHLREARRIPSHIAKKRQIAFLAKQMRREEDETLEAIRQALDANSEGARRQVAEMHRAEDWRTRLLEGGDEALAAFIADHPDADRQRIRQLVRNAKDEAARNKPPKSFRELYREIRNCSLVPADTAAESAAEDDPEPTED